MKKQGILTVFSGFSGAGKGTVMKALMKNHPEQYALSISCTSRKPRVGEEDGREYFFKTREEFEELIRKEELLEHAEYVGNYYGTPAAYVKEKLDAGIDVILEIELQGALQIKERLPQTVLIFLTPPSAEDLESRLKGRGTETEEVIKSRLKRAAEESLSMEEYDFIVVNDDLDTCVEEVHNLIQACHAKKENRMELIDAIQKDVSRFLTDDNL